jgi:hypothetical protein
VTGILDIHSNQPSADYRIHFRQRLERALLMLSVIGKEWSGPRADGNARIFDRNDPVRVEVETALSNGRVVMPVLVNGAGMPTEANVPGSLKLFPYLHAIEVRSGDEFAGCDGCIEKPIDPETFVSEVEKLFLREPT